MRPAGTLCVNGSEEALVSDLMVIVYPSRKKAEDVRRHLLQLQEDYLIELDDAVIAGKETGGMVRVDQLVSPTALGAATGSLCGLLLGAIFLTPVTIATAGSAGAVLGAAGGAALGAASGAISGALADLGIDDDFVRGLAETLQPGHAALFLLIRKMTTDRVVAALRGTGGTVCKTSFDHGKDEALREAISDTGPAPRTGEMRRVP
jgi:uncharacterized membrane protein